MVDSPLIWRVSNQQWTWTEKGVCQHDEPVGSGQSQPFCCNRRCHSQSGQVKRDECLVVEDGLGTGMETEASGLLGGHREAAAYPCCAAECGSSIRRLSWSWSADQTRPKEVTAYLRLIWRCFGCQNRTSKLSPRCCHGMEAVACGHRVQKVCHRRSGRGDDEAGAGLQGWREGAKRWVCQC